MAAAALMETPMARYEEAGPLLLSRTPNVPEESAKAKLWQSPSWNALCNHLEARLVQLRNWRLSWWQHWALIGTYLLPRRNIWLTQGAGSQPVPNSMVRGRQINQAILDSTGTDAMEICAAGMMSGLTSPSRPWFKLKPSLSHMEPDAEARAWFEDVEEKIYATMAKSNFYDAFAQMFEDLVAYGTGPVIIYEDREDIIRCYNPACGEYMVAVSSAMRAETLYRQFVMTVSAIVEMFGLENCPASTQSLWATKGANLEVEQIVCHAIEPNFPITDNNGQKADVLKGDFTWRETYWIWGDRTSRPLSIRGFKDAPHIVPRWAVTSNDPYGRSPGMKCLPDVMQLQVMSGRYAEAIEKQVRPPLLADSNLKNQPSSILPGHVTYVADISKGMKSIYDVQLDLAAIAQNMEHIRQRIKEGMYNGLFLMISNMEGVQPRNELEIAERRNEKMQVLGPVIERFQNEAGSPAIKRIFNILARKGLLPPLPDSLQNVPIDIEYVSMLALAQRGAALASIERLIGLTGNLAGAKPEVLDLVNGDETVRVSADMLSTPLKILNSPEVVDQIRQQRAQQMQAQQQAQMAASAAQAVPVAADAAQTLSQTQVGAGNTALDLLLSGGRPAGNA